MILHFQFLDVLGVSAVKTMLREYFRVRLREELFM